MLGGIEWDNRNFGFHIRFFRFTHIVHSYFGNKKAMFQKNTALNTKSVPTWDAFHGKYVFMGVAFIRWKKWGSPTIRVQMESNLNGVGMSIRSKKL